MMNLSHDYFTGDSSDIMCIHVNFRYNSGDDLNKPQIFAY